MVDVFNLLKDTIGGVVGTAADVVGQKVTEGVAAFTAAQYDAINKDPTKLDAAIEMMGADAQAFYKGLGPSGQENLKGIIAQDPKFLPALANAMEKGGAAGINGYPPGITNLVLAEMNKDPKFREQVVNAMQNDPSKLMEVVGKEATSDLGFGALLGREGFKSILNGDLSLGSFAGMDMGGMLKGMMGGMLGGLMEMFSGFMQNIMGAFGKIFDGLKGVLGGDTLMQSVGDAKPGDRPVDAVNALGQILGIVNPDGKQYVAKDGAVVEYNAAVTVGPDTAYDPKKAGLGDPSNALAMGPR